MVQKYTGCNSTRVSISTYQYSSRITYAVRGARTAFPDGRNVKGEFGKLQLAARRAPIMAVSCKSPGVRKTPRPSARQLCMRRTWRLDDGSRLKSNFYLYEHSIRRDCAYMCAGRCPT
ncbi:hypothetical protein EVAR_97297_1 [Eumeta japonica]|uniref:Uncharacterized protein n=1 Tax=Eumeta variegata TaxID=151549 RepID=A0A4C1XI48_EUMVA|nr:hypothetical protein EVAR_97297_1 [Eumeta japonica]